MKKTMSGTLMNVLVVFMMLASAVQPAMGVHDGKPVENTALNDSASDLNVENDNGAGSNTLLEKKSYSKVIVATTNVPELAIYLSDYDYDGIIGTQQSNRNGVAFPVLSVPPSAIEGIAALPEVLGVYDYVDPISATNTDGTSFSRGLLGLGPNSAIQDSLDIETGSLYHGAEEAWNNGYTGEGVKIATITGGTDFGHPELAGRQATITNSSSPYYGYPIVYDPTSMSSFVDSGLQASTLDPSESWYVNTSSSDLHIYHTVIVDGVNDFWAESNIHNSSQSVYPLSMTSEARSLDTAEDVSAFELDLRGLYAGSDNESWYMGFNVTPETDNWKRSIDVNYGLYFDVDNVAGSGARTDPLGKHVSPSAKNRPEFAIYFEHTGPKWGVTGSITTYSKVDMQGVWSDGTMAVVDWGVDTNGKWSHNKTINADSTGTSKVVSDISVWSKNNTIQNATFHTWIEDSWKSMTLNSEMPFNETVGINPAAGWMIVTDANNTKYVRHNAKDYQLLSNNSILYNQSGYFYVDIELISGAQAFGGDFIEFSIPKKVIPSVNSFSTILFSTGINASHAQDSVPSDPAVAFEDPAWDSGSTTLSAFRFINEPQQYVIAGVPSVSGKPRIGLHPDQNLMNQQYGRPVAVLLTDSYESGKYDAIYVDLDNDKNFADEIPMQEYGAYNDSLMIGPRWGTERLANNSIIHNGTWYQLKEYINTILWSNETLTSNATAGQYEFYVGNTSVNPSTVTIERPTQHNYSFNNDTVAYLSDPVGSETVPWSINLPNVDISNITIFMKMVVDKDPYLNGSDDPNPNTWIYEYPSLDVWESSQIGNWDPPYVPVTYDPLSGTVTFNDDRVWNDPYNFMMVTEFYAWYNYTIPVDVDFTFDDSSGKITLDEPLTAGDYLDVSYSYTTTEINNITSAHRHGLISYNSELCEIELRDWSTSRDIDSDGGKGDGKYYPDLSGGMAYFIASETEIDGEVLDVGNNTSNFANKFVVEDSVTIYINGTIFDEKNATINYLDGKVDFLISIDKTDVITVDYSYRIPVPYSNLYWEWNSIEKVDRKLPGNGDMIALFGEYTESSIQGTQIGSTICAGGVMADQHKEDSILKPNTLVKGMAPDAKLISIRGGAFASWYFAVEGYDGIIGTDDDAQIVAITTNFPVSNSGWDIYTKGAEYIGKYYAKGKVIFVAGTGDNGFGYGTAQSPGSSEATITAGQGTMFDYRCYTPGAPSGLGRAYADGGKNPQHGDILPSSGRGPNMLGNPEPDVITTGAFQFGSIPLNVDQDYTTIDYDWYGGQWAWDLWSGPAVSTSSTAGILALIYGAYWGAKHEVINEEVLHTTTNTTVVNLMHSPVVAGTVTILINNTVVTNYIINLATGKITFASNVTFGKWINASYTFTNDYPDVDVARSLLKSGADNMNYDILTQGSGWSNAERSTNLAAELDGIYLDKTYWVPGDYRGIRYEGFVKLMKPGESATQNVTISNKNPATQSIQVYDSIYHKFGNYSINMNITRNYDDPDTPGIINIEPFIAVGTELLKVTATSSRKTTMQTYMAELFDWTDANENGLVDFPTEQNRITYVIGTNSLELRYRDPLGRSTDGLIAQVKGFGGAGEALDEWVLNMEFYKKVDWSWLTIPNAPSTVNGYENSTITMDLNVPDYADVGSYEGAVYIDREANEELVATGAGLLMENVPFGWWDQNPETDLPQSWARPNDSNVSTGSRIIVPKSTKIFWNDIVLYEDVDYELDGTSQIHFFNAINNATQTLVPWNAPYFNMTYLTVGIVNGTPTENATWTGQTSIPNLVAGNYTIKKDGVNWDETQTVLNEKVITSTGNETRASSLFNRNVVRDTTTLSKNGVEWLQDGGLISELSDADADQTTIQLNHGNVVPGTTLVEIDSKFLNQTEEISLVKKEVVQGLNSTVKSTSLTLTYDAGVGGDNKTFWYENGKWYAQLQNDINGNKSTFKMVTYLLFDNGISMNELNNFTMHVNDTIGKIIFKHELDLTHTYTAKFTWCNNSLQYGQLAHALVISDSYKLYKNGASMKVTEYFIELETGVVKLTEPLGANEVVEAAYQYNVYVVDLRNGYITLANKLVMDTPINVTYRFFVYTLDLSTGVIEFANNLSFGDVITADYTFAMYTLDLVKGIVKFASPLRPWENVTCTYFYYSNVIPVFFNIGADKPDFSFAGPDITPYSFQITGGTDVAGNSLANGAVQNPLTFTSGYLSAPAITNAIPVNGAINVALTTDVVVTFSEAMATASVAFTCVPTVTTWSVVWSVGNTVATYSHTGAFVENTVYKFQIIAGTDVDGNALAGAVPNPWTFKTVGIHPTITNTVPANGTTSTARTANVVVTFSEAMSPASVTFTCVPIINDWVVVWSAGNTVATYSHATVFAENTLHTFRITAGNDAKGVALATGALPNPWTFTTLDAPIITTMDPMNGATDVALTANVVVTFSEAMTTASVTYTCTPDPAGWSVVWSNGNKTATYSHSASFTESTLYTFQITAGTDSTGNSLMAGASLNPWSFSTGVAPIITVTNPANGATDVALTANVLVTFSKSMNITSVAYTCTPDPTGWSVIWGAGNTIATYSHTGSFIKNTVYAFDITAGTDVAGNALVTGTIPNPWTFTTIDIPIITDTVPVNGTSNIALTADVIVTFSLSMNTTSVLFTCTPDPGGWSEVWSSGDTIVTYSHSIAFTENTLYTFEITAGTDVAGTALVTDTIPNPWTFATLGASPTITVTNPVNGATGVSLTADVIVTFSKEMDIGSVTYTCTPDPGGWSEVWSSGNTIVTYSHSIAFTENTLYTFDITAGTDVAGNPVVPGAVWNPWTFTAVAIQPTLIVTNPVNGATGVSLTADVIVTFSKPMNTGSVTYTCTPDPGGWSEVWSNGDTIVTYSHSVFTEDTLQTFEITAGFDLAGNPMVPGAVWNPWTFMTAREPPTIIGTIPANSEVEVALDSTIEVTFSEEMNIGSVFYTCTPDPGGWSEVWSSGNTIVTYSHSIDFNASTQYTFRITAGTDVIGNSLVADAIPNPWTFTTLGSAITNTVPANEEMDVALDTWIEVTFSEAMNITTVTYACTPDPGGWSVVWSIDNMTATYSHTDFIENTLYTFKITAGTDINGVILAAGTVPNPWTFITTMEPPTIIETSPTSGATGIELTSAVVVTFSEPMNTATVTYSISPIIDGAWTTVWSAGNTVVTYSHATAFNEKVLYSFRILAGIDINGVPLAMSTLFKFTTVGIPPMITNTNPANTATGVELTSTVVVTFSEAMNIGSVTYSCNPAVIGWSVAWSSGNTVATYSHTDSYAENTLYTFTITAGKDLKGNLLAAGTIPNPWTFTTLGSPTIESTVPANAAKGVLLTANIVVNFSEAMNPTSVTYTCTPDPTGWSVVWSDDNTNATFSHTTAFIENTLYTFTITAGSDVAGNPLMLSAVPNPWTFTTIGVSPTITITNPVNGATSVALASTVIVTFSEPMNIDSVKYTCKPDQTSWSFVWSAGNTIVTYSYVGGFYESTIYTFQITAGTDIAGNALAAGAIPNPWIFTTIGAPSITNTVSANGATGVALSSSIVVTFSEAMATASVTYACVPAVTVWSVVWSSGNTVATYSHTNPYTENTLYTFTITSGTDLSGNALVPGAVPNPWTFTTVGISPSIIATSPVNGATGVALTSTVVITFSESMIPSSVTFTCTPDPTGWSVVWNADNTIATYSHLIAFTESISVSVAKFAYDDLFRYNEIRGGYGNEGDWHYIFMDVMERGKYNQTTPNERLLVDVMWENDQSDVDVQVFGGRDALPAWQYDAFPQDRYGPHSVSFVGGSDETAGFFTTTGGPEEISAPRISSGLNVIGLHTVGLNGSVDSTEIFSAKVGTMYIDTTEVKVVTNQLVGETELNMVSNMEWAGVGGIAAGPSAPEKLKDQAVTQDDPDWTHFDTFQDQLASGKTVYSRTIQDCLIFNVHIWGRAGVVDMDLGVFLDGSGANPNKDGKVQVDEYVAMCADADADEEVKLIAPKDGTYLIVPFGFTLTTNPALFDMDITIVQGTGFDVQGKGVNSLPADQKGYFSSNQTEEPFNQTNLKLKWDLPGSAAGTLQGALYVGPGNGPMCMLVPIELTIDTIPPVISGPTPMENSSLMNRRPNIAISVADSIRGELESSTLKLYLDGIDITTQSTVSVPLITDDLAPVKGYPDGTATYTPTTALIDGNHIIKTVIEDKAGNIATKEWSFTVDTNAPYFEITNPPERVSYTNAASIDITGYTEFGLEPKLIGAVPSATSMSDDGAFTITLPLITGENSFILQTTDLAGNSKQIMSTIFRDLVFPEYTSVRFSTGFTTNSPTTVLEGKMSEAGTLFVNDANIPVNADGSFEQMLGLSEGRNTFHLEFTDRAGNAAHSWQNVTLDTVAPTLTLEDGETIVKSQSFLLTGTVEPGSELFVNGKRIDVGTRQSSGDFSTTLTLSRGLNTIVIEAQDSAGNMAEIRHIVEYDTSGVNYGAIGLMVALLIIGLVLGIFLAPFISTILGRKKEEQPEETEPVIDGAEEISPETQEAEPVIDGTEEISPETQEVESVVDGTEEISPETQDSEALEEMPADESLEVKPETEALEPIPTEESIPEELPETLAPIEAEPEEVAPAEVESEELPPIEPAEIEDPKITKLKAAYESGKISKELYEKNLAKFKDK